MGGRCVWLVGMMGAGKSTLGPRLAARLGRAFVDADAVLEHEAGASVAELFATRGETAFRALERDLMERLAGDDAVVALGGGAIAQPGAPERLAASGTVVYLRACPETLLARVGDAESRPLLAGRPPAERLERLRALLAEREAAYASARVVVDVDDLDPGATLDAVLTGLERAGAP